MVRWRAGPGRGPPGPLLLLMVIMISVLPSISCIRCQCSTSKGGIPCNLNLNWCEVNKLNEKVGACAVVRSGSQQHFACVRVKESSEDTCKVDTNEDGSTTTRCWCRSGDYCNLDLLEDLDKLPQSQENELREEDSPETESEPPFQIEKSYDTAEDSNTPPSIREAHGRQHPKGRAPHMNSLLHTSNSFEDSGTQGKREDEILWEREEAEMRRKLLAERLEQQRERLERQRQQQEEERRRKSEEESRRQDEERRRTDIRRREEERRHRERVEEERRRKEQEEIRRRQLEMEEEEEMRRRQFEVEEEERKEREKESKRTNHRDHGDQDEKEIEEQMNWQHKEEEEMEEEQQRLADETRRKVEKEEIERQNRREYERKFREERLRKEKEIRERLEKQQKEIEERRRREREEEEEERKRKEDELERERIKEREQQRHLLPASPGRPLLMSYNEQSAHQIDSVVVAPKNRQQSSNRRRPLDVSSLINQNRKTPNISAPLPTIPTPREGLGIMKIQSFISQETPIETTIKTTTTTTTTTTSTTIRITTTTTQTTTTTTPTTTQKSTTTMLREEKRAEEASNWKEKYKKEKTTIKSVNRFENELSESQEDSNPFVEPRRAGISPDSAKSTQILVGIAISLISLFLSQ